MTPSIRSGFRRQGTAVLFVIWAASVPTIARAQVGEERGNSPIVPVERGQRVFTCAHSFHGFVYRSLGEMAKSAGIKDHQSVGSSMIGGSRVIQHWDVPEEKNQAKAALIAGKVDV